MKKFLSISMVVLAFSTSLNAASPKTKTVVPVVYKSCALQAFEMYDDMVDCGMAPTRAANYAINHYNYCMDARVAHAMGTGLSSQ